VTTLAEVFAQHGYRTAGFTATPMLAKSMGYGRGFQHYEDFTTSRMDYVRAETVVNAALNWIRSVGAHDKYFLYMHFEEPHPPWNRECPWCDRSDPAEPPTNCTTIPPDALFDEEVLSKDVFVRNYDGAIWYADNQVGRLLNAIKERGDLDDTVIAVSADHGYELLDRYEIGHGRNPFDEVVKVPLILYGDGTRSSAKQAAIIDIGPTILGSVGIAKPEGFEGRDLIRSGFEQDPVAFTQGYGVVSARTNRYKLVEIRWDDDVTRPRYVKAYGFQLFDLQEDKGELTDAKDKYPREFESLKRELLEYSKMVVEVAGKAKRRNKNLDKETLERLRALGYIK
jgi:arylsulfatase A-like enzyme